MSTKALSKRKRTAERAPASRSKADRAIALRSLRRLVSPHELLASESEQTLVVVLHAVETLMRVAHPLPLELRRSLRPWVLESERRRREVLREVRVLEAARESTRGARA